MDFSHFRLEKARPDQSQAICDLVNLTYRGETGRTRETHIIQGDRTHRQEIETVMSNPDAHFFVVNQPQTLASSIYVAKEKENAYIGFFQFTPICKEKDSTSMYSSRPKYLS